MAQSSRPRIRRGARPSSILPIHSRVAYRPARRMTPSQAGLTPARRYERGMVVGPGGSRRSRRGGETQTHGRKPLYRRGGFWASIATLVGAGALGYLLLRERPQPPAREKAPTERTSPEKAPGISGKPIIPQAKPGRIEPLTVPGGKEPIPEAAPEKTYEEKLMDRKVRKDKAKAAIENLAYTLYSLEYQKNPSWKQPPNMNPKEGWTPSTEWTKSVKVGQKLQCVDTGLNESYFGIIIETNPIKIQGENGGSYTPEEFFPGKSYVESVYNPK